MAINGMGIMLKTMGIDPDQIQAQIGAFGEGMKAFVAKLDSIEAIQRDTNERLMYLDAKMDALHRALDERFPMDPLALTFPGAHEQEFASGNSLRLPVMDDAAIEATKAV